MELKVTVREEQGSYWSVIAELPGCFATGGTLSELREALAEAIGMYLWDLPARLDGTLDGAGECTLVATPLAAWPAA